MRFEYTEFVTAAPDNGDPVLMLRPIVTIRVHGNERERVISPLVDTDANHCIFPEWIAEQLSIPTAACSGPLSEGISGTAVSMTHGWVDLELKHNAQGCRWRTQLVFTDASAVRGQAVLGQMGFLQFFRATFDTADDTFELLPNEYLPRLD